MKKILIYISLVAAFLTTGHASWAQEPGSDDENKAIQGMLGNILKQGNKANTAEVPEKYAFDYMLTMEIWEEGEDRERMVMMWNENQDITGILAEENMMVFDNTQDIIVQYDEKKMEANVLPNVMKGMGKYLKPEMEDEMEILSVEKTGNKKVILGYACEEILVETEDDKSRSWITYDLNTSLQDVLSSSMDLQFENFIDEKYYDDFQGAMGMYIEATSKKNGEVRYTEVIEIQEDFNIDNSKYKVQRQ